MSASSGEAGSPSAIVLFGEAGGQKGFEAFRRECLAKAPALFEAAPAARTKCAIQLASLAGRRRVFRSQIYECVSRLRTIDGWATILDDEDVLAKLQHAGYGRTWDNLSATARGVAGLGEQQDSGASEEEESLVQHEDDFLVLSASDFDVEGLHKFFLSFCDLALHISNTEQQQEISSNLAEYEKCRAQQLKDACLHYVFGGLVSAGKTTLINSFVANGLRDFPPEVNLLPSDILENTSAVTVLDLNSHGPDVQVYCECVQLGEVKPDQSLLQEEDVSRRRMVWETTRYGESSFASIPNLVEALPDIMSTLKKEVGKVKRLIIKLPLPFEPVHDDSTPEAANKLSSWYNRLGQKTAKQPGWQASTAAPGVDSPPFSKPIIVDTPGLDSQSLMSHLVTMLEQKCFVFCFLVDMTKPNPFGNQGFKVLKYLQEHVHIPFPPVIVLTKWEEFREKWDNPRWVKKNARNETPEQVATRLINIVLSKLKDAGIARLPYFAAVNALSALQSERDADEEEGRREVTAAKRGMCSFMRKLDALGRQVASPLLAHRRLLLLGEQTQKTVNIILRDNEDAQILGMSALGQLREAAESIKKKYMQCVDTYFNGIKWTKHGVVSFKPPEPFNRGDCAVNLIPNIFLEEFTDYKSIHEADWSMHACVGEVGIATLKRIQVAVFANMVRYEDEMMNEIKTTLWQKATIKRNVLSEALQNGKGDYLVIGVAGMGYLGLLGAVGGTFLIGPLAWCAFPVVGIGLAWWGRQELGMWSWEGAESKALEVVLASLEQAVPDLKQTLKDAFAQKVDATMKNIEEYRIPLESREDTQIASSILKKVRAQTKGVEERISDLMQADVEQRWLVGDSHLKDVWLAACKASGLC